MLLSTALFHLQNLDKKRTQKCKMNQFLGFSIVFFFWFFGKKKLKPPVFNVQFQYLAKSIEGYILKQLSYLA
jgi:hypothetical protein